MIDDIELDDRDFGRLFARYQSRIYGYIRSLVMDRSDAEDLLQETGSILWQKFGEFQPGSNFVAWALQVARYEVLHFRQRQKRDLLHSSERFVDAVSADVAADALQLDSLERFLAGCMEQLAPAERELFAQRYQTDVTTKGLAEKLGRPSSTVYDTINRIRRTLTACVERALNKEARE
jgi:RNA polymerase sigma-70 factor (ECF subfamily)